MEEYLTIREVSEKWGMSQRWVQILCNHDKIPGIKKFGRAWAIPKDAKKPEDGRVINGKYRNWRNKLKATC